MRKVGASPPREIEAMRGEAIRRVVTLSTLDMRITKTMKNVPTDQVPELVREFMKAGAATVDVSDNGDGTSDVTATFER